MDTIRQHLVRLMARPIDTHDLARLARDTSTPVQAMIASAMLRDLLEDADRSDARPMPANDTPSQ